MPHVVFLLAGLLALLLPSLVRAQSMPFSYAVMCTGKHGEKAIFMQEAMQITEVIPEQSAEALGVFHQQQMEIAFEEGMVVALGRPDLRPYATDDFLRITAHPSGAVQEYSYLQEGRIDFRDASMLMTDMLEPGTNTLEITLENRAGDRLASSGYWVMIWQSCRSGPPSSDLTGSRTAALRLVDEGSMASPITHTQAVSGVVSSSGISEQPTPAMPGGIPAPFFFGRWMLLAVTGMVFSLGWLWRRNRPTF